ncbi:hypothetical protein BDV93DRAFT_522168 [Ceratobasidium sp. AG-I]|nr:hypothetical protein BDV93DRAFT_522168 [Ceratobasidium sp. AG-I]
MLKELLPLPGISELEGIVRGLIQRSKDLSYEEDKRLELAARLENLIGCAKQLDDLSELSKTLGDIQNRLESVLKSNSRLGIHQARRKIAAWEELNRRLDRVMEVTLLQLVAKPRNTRIKHDALECYNNKLPVIPACEIVGQVEIFAQGFYGLHDGEYYPQNRRLYRDVASRCRSGRFGKLSVTYKTFNDRSVNDTVKVDNRNYFE